MLDWHQFMELLDKIGICGVTLLLLVWHMVREERMYRRYEQRRRLERNEEE